MTFREPVVFTPLDIKIGYLYYGGKDYWSHNLYTTSDLTNNNSPILLDSTQYSFNRGLGFCKGLLFSLFSICQL